MKHRFSAAKVRFEGQGLERRGRIETGIEAQVIHQLRAVFEPLFLDPLVADQTRPANRWPAWRNRCRVMI